MAIHGYCKACEKLVEIRPGSPKIKGGGALNWFPLTHTDGKGNLCPGDEKPI